VGEAEGVYWRFSDISQGEVLVLSAMGIECYGMRWALEWVGVVTGARFHCCRWYITARSMPSRWQMSRSSSAPHGETPRPRPHLRTLTHPVSAACSYKLRVLRSIRALGDVSHFPLQDEIDSDIVEGSMSYCR